MSYVDLILSPSWHLVCSTCLFSVRRPPLRTSHSTLNTPARSLSTRTAAEGPCSAQATMRASSVGRVPPVWVALPLSWVLRHTPRHRHSQPFPASPRSPRHVQLDIPPIQPIPSLPIVFFTDVSRPSDCVRLYIIYYLAFGVDMGISSHDS